MHHSTYLDEWVTQITHRCASVASAIAIFSSHISAESCRTYEWVMSHMWMIESHTNHDSPCASVASAITIFFSRNFQLSTEAHDLFFKNSRENANFDTRSPRCVPGARGRRSRLTNSVGSFGKCVGLFGYILGVLGARRYGYSRGRSLLTDIVFSVGRLLSADRFWQMCRSLLTNMWVSFCKLILEAHTHSPRGWLQGKPLLAHIVVSSGQFAGRVWQMCRSLLANM